MKLLYSKTEEELLIKIDRLIKIDIEEKYRSGLIRWLEWYSSIKTPLPPLSIGDKKFYRASVGPENLLGVQIWEHDTTVDVNVWVANYIMNGDHEDNTEMTQIIV